MSLLRENRSLETSVVFQVILLLFDADGSGPGLPFGNFVWMMIPEQERTWPSLASHSGPVSGLGPDALYSYQLLKLFDIIIQY